MAGLFDYLSNTMQSPLFLGGAAMFGGGGMEGAMQGMRTGAGLQDQQRQRQLADQRQQAFGQLLGKGGIDPQTAALASAMGPDGGLEYLAKMSDPMRALEMQKAKADLAAAPLDLEYRRAQIGKLKREPAGGELPSNIREWQMYQSMSPEDQQRYLTMKRSEKYLDLGTNFARPNAVDPTAAPIATFQKDVAGEAAQKQVGEAQGKAAFDLPRQEDNASVALKTINDIRNHPGKKWGVGATGIIPGIPGTEQRGFVNLVDQAKGQVFLQAFNSLRGGGQITEAEGAKATQALARLDRAQRPEDFDAALTDLEAIVKAGLGRARTSTGGRAAGASPAEANPYKSKYGLE